MEQITRKKEHQQKWGPVMAERRRTRSRMGDENILIKAQNLKMRSDLELSQQRKGTNTNSGLNNHHVNDMAKVVGG